MVPRSGGIWLQQLEGEYPGITEAEPTLGNQKAMQCLPHRADPPAHGFQVCVPRLAQVVGPKHIACDLGSIGWWVRDLGSLEHFQHGLRIYGCFF